MDSGHTIAYANHARADPIGARLNRFGLDESLVKAHLFFPPRPLLSALPATPLNTFGKVVDRFKLKPRILRGLGVNKHLPENRSPASFLRFAAVAIDHSVDWLVRKERVVVLGEDEFRGIRALAPRPSYTSDGRL